MRSQRAYILLIESDSWGYFRPTPAGFDTECIPEPPNVIASEQAKRSIVLVSAEVTLQAMLNGKLTLAEVFKDRLMILDAPQAHAALLHSALNVAIPAEGFSRFICS